MLTECMEGIADRHHGGVEARAQQSHNQQVRLGLSQNSLIGEAIDAAGQTIGSDRFTVAVTLNPLERRHSLYQ
ncbi:hypothetical protein D9M71_645080 [compost metagenome]